LMVSFYDEALILFERHLKKGFSVTPINITAEELNELYEKTVFHVFPAEEIIPFSQSSLRRF
ncbi:hypothetical protein J1785_03035, partial [Rahnella sp. SL6]|uniref:hypothetical protein n=1 Tax=Rahnella perminowiae TaxID=2816244 RepID=UPI001C27D0AA